MTPAEVKSLVHEEIERMFGGDDDVVFTDGRNGNNHRQPTKLFFDRFLEVMTSVHCTLKELSQRVATVEHRLYDLEQVMRHRGENLARRPEGR